MFRRVSSKLRRRRVDTEKTAPASPDIKRAIDATIQRHTAEAFERAAIRSIRNPPTGSTAQRKSSSQTRVSTGDVSHPSSVLFLPTHDGGPTCDPPSGSDCA